MMVAGLLQLLGIISILGCTLLVQSIGTLWSDVEARLLLEDDFTVLLTPSRNINSISGAAWSSIFGPSVQENLYDLARMSNIHLSGTGEVEETSNTSAFRPQEYVIGMTRYTDKGHFPRSPDFANLYRCILIS
jgi:hypothetical protein